MRANLDGAGEICSLKSRRSKWARVAKRVQILIGKKVNAPRTERGGGGGNERLNRLAGNLNISASQFILLNLLKSKGKTGPRKVDVPSCVVLRQSLGVSAKEPAVRIEAGLSDRDRNLELTRRLTIVLDEIS